MPVHRRLALLALLGAAGSLACDPGSTEPDEPPSAPSAPGRGLEDGGAEADAGLADPPPVDAGRGADPEPGPDAGPTGADAAAAEPPTDGTVPMFVASGHMGRTTISCDDGRTWVADRSFDDAARCFTGGLDCDHHPGAARGIAWGDGWFFTTHGWGAGGAVRRSRDGVEWEPLTDGTTFGGVAFGAGTLLGGAREPRVSADHGESWTDGGPTGLSVWSIRRTAFADHDGGRFVMVASNDGLEVVLSSDGGASWWHPERIPGECGAGIQDRGGIAHGAGTLLIVGGNGLACRSTDGGATWTAHRVAGAVDSHLVWTGDRFAVWSEGTVHTSPDGASWTAAPTEPADLVLGAVAHSPETGTFVAVNRGWQRWYGQQRFYRSADGVSWESLNEDAFVGSHPVRFLAFGRGEASVACEPR